MPIFNEDYSAITTLGNDLKMECILINSRNSPVTIHWDTPTFIKEINKTDIHNLKIKVMANTTIHISSLTVKNVSMNDFGLYKCLVTDFNKMEIGFAGRKILRKVNTTYKRDSIKYFNRTKIRIIENENCELLCEASYPITWSYDLNVEKKLIPKNIFIRTSNKNLVYQSILNIKLATYKNNGFYYCEERNTWNENENTLYKRKIFIYVVKDATLIKSLAPNEKISEIYIQRHSPHVTIPCIPKTTTNSICILHNLNQKKFKSNSSYNLLSYEFDFDVNIDDDIFFECSCPIKKKHIYDYSFIENIILVKVYESFPEKTLPYTNLEYNKNVAVGEELKLNCTILRYCKQCKPNGRLNVTWSYNVNSTNVTNRMSFHDKYIPLYNAELYLSTLVIKTARKTDSYEYKCYVGNLTSKMNVIVFDEKLFVDFVTVSFIIVTIVFITIIVMMILFIKQVKLQSKIRKAGLSNFNKGVKGILNPKLYINLQADMLPYDTKLEIPRSKIKIGQPLGSGNFGLVFKGEIFDQFSEQTFKTVAIKMIQRNLKYEHMKILIIELKILSILGKHLNVIDLLGACTENLDKMELLVILEYCQYGNIRDILRNNRDHFVNLINKSGKIVTSTKYENIICNEKVENFKDNCNYNEKITTNTLINWAYQISCGMKFMASRKVLHGDLAARNILLDENHIVKICDFGLSKNLNIYYNYKKKTQCPLPIKWMAIESIRDKTFSTQSDVWSFGIVLWELFSLAETPYPNLQENIEFFHVINNGYRMEQPIYSTKEIYHMMLKCWEHNPKRRPSFALINYFFNTILTETSRNHYLELSNEFVAELNSNQQKKYLETKV